MRATLSALCMLALAAGPGAASPVFAQDEQEPEYGRCVDRAKTNPQFSACGGALLERREAVLNRVWKSTYATLDAAAKKALLDEQRAWIAFKDKSCAPFTTGYFGREGQVIHYYSCRAGVIDARITYLKDLVDPDGPGDNYTQ